MPEDWESGPEKPETTPASAVEGGREVSNKILYVGGLHKTVSEDDLRQLFTMGVIQSVKLLNDKNRPGFNYAFIEFDNTQSAQVAIQSLDGTLVNDSPLKINWAYQSSNANSEKSTEPLFSIFVGDLSPEVDDETLTKAFSKFNSLKQAHVMWDMQTSRSRGYGFVTFKQYSDAENAIQSMNKQWISGRSVRCNWASHKQVNDGHRARQNRQYYNMIPQPMLDINQKHDMAMLQRPLMSMRSGAGTPAAIPYLSPQSYDLVLRQTPSWQTTVYLGNIAHFTDQSDLILLLQNFGFIVDFKYHSDKGCAFVKYDSHERAALAIVQLTGYTVNGRPLKCGWGKDRPPVGFRPMYQ